MMMSDIISYLNGCLPINVSVDSDLLASSLRILLKLQICQD